VLRTPDARDLFEYGPVLVAHASMTAKRLNLQAPTRGRGVFDVLELYAFTRPATFCAPSAVGLATALGLPEPKGAAAQAQTLRDAAAALLHELAMTPRPSREEALAVAETLARAGWAWGPAVVGALRSAPVGNQFRSSGLDVWARAVEWEDQAPPGEPGSRPVDPERASERLKELLHRSGLDEVREAQDTFAREAAYAFAPREREGEPQMMLAEAGTGVGKTLGYLAPASVWAEMNGPAVWISTYTRALQRQIERESHSIYPDPLVRARKAVVRKGRENYLCLLNFQEQVNTAQLGNGDLIGLALAARWARASRDGDMTGGDFPAWLPTLFAIPPSVQAGPANLVDRRGECIHAGCQHYRVCFIEKAVRASKRADIVIANHALVLSQAAFDGARAARGLKGDNETTSLKRIVFDEGHHLFDAADSAFSAALSGAEAAEMRRWLRGPEGRGRRGRGLEARLLDIIGEREGARAALNAALQAAAALPGEGWSGRIAPPDGQVNPIGPIETYLVSVIEQLRARVTDRPGAAEQGLQCAARPAIDLVRERAGEASRALAGHRGPAAGPGPSPGGRAGRGGRHPADLGTGADRGRAARPGPPGPHDPAGLALDPQGHRRGRRGRSGVRRLVRGHLPVRPRGRRRLPPPLGGPDRAAARGRPLARPRRAGDQRHPDRSGPGRPVRPGRDAHRRRAPAAVAQGAAPGLAVRLRQQRPAFVVTDVGKDDPRQVSAAMRELFLAAGGGGLGLFTAIRRLKAVHERIAAPLADQGLALYAQHVDPLEAGALVDIFRAEEDACLLGTDAIRDGIDVPGRSLRLLVFDRVPWPRPDVLHKARRARFGGKGYDDSTARARISQAFGRLIRRADDRGRVRDAGRRRADPPVFQPARGRDDRTGKPGRGD
jgi:ATP-dependent DNA helicase DinG